MEQQTQSSIVLPDGLDPLVVKLNDTYNASVPYIMGPTLLRAREKVLVERKAAAEAIGDEELAMQSGAQLDVIRVRLRFHSLNPPERIIGESVKPKFIDVTSSTVIRGLIARSRYLLLQRNVPPGELKRAAKRLLAWHVQDGKQQTQSFADRISSTADELLEEFQVPALTLTPTILSALRSDVRFRLFDAGIVK